MKDLECSFVFYINKNLESNKKLFYEKYMLNKRFYDCIKKIIKMIWNTYIKIFENFVN